MIKYNLIQIDVNGLTACGKSHVMSVIKKALEIEYNNAQICSFDLQIELNANNEKDLVQPNPEDTIFVLNEGRPSDYMSFIGRT